MKPSSRRRLVGAAAALMLIGATLLSTAGSALAGTTRDIYVGSDPAFSADPGTLTFSPVTAGGSSVTNVFVKNIDNQTLNHVVLTFLLNQGGVTLSGTAFGTNASSCSSDGTTLTCDFGQLKQKATRSWSMWVDAAGSGSFQFNGKVFFDESLNPNGGNTQINDVFGTVDVGSPNCQNVQTFVPPGQVKNLNLPTGLTGCNPDQQSGLVIPAKADGSLVTLGDGGTATGCPSGFTCMGDTITASVNGGAPVDPYLKWTVFYSNTILGTTKPDRVSFLHDTTIIKSIKNGGLCKNATSTNCQEQFVVSSTGVTFFVRTPTNLLIKGMH